MLLGFITGLTLSHQAALLAGTAFVGAYTTFSTWMLETQRLTEERQIWPAVANLVVSVALGAARGDARPVDREPAVNDTYLKLTAYFGERQRAGSRFWPTRCWISTPSERWPASVMLRGIASFGPRHVIRSDQSLTLSEDPPVAIAAVDTAATIGALVGDVVE